jgi:hypothetical protein
LQKRIALITSADAVAEILLSPSRCLARKIAGIAIVRARIRRTMRSQKAKARAKKKKPGNAGLF